VCSLDRYSLGRQGEVIIRRVAYRTKKEQLIDEFGIMACQKTRVFAMLAARLGTNIAKVPFTEVTASEIGGVVTTPG